MYSSLEARWDALPLTSLKYPLASAWAMPWLQCMSPWVCCLRKCRRVRGGCDFTAAIVGLRLPLGEYTALQVQRRRADLHHVGVGFGLAEDSVEVRLPESVFSGRGSLRNDPLCFHPTAERGNRNVQMLAGSRSFKPCIRIEWWGWGFECFHNRNALSAHSHLTNSRCRLPGGGKPVPFYRSPWKPRGSHSNQCKPIEQSSSFKSLGSPLVSQEPS